MTDVEKTFNSVSWTFIEKGLDFFNFSPEVKRCKQTFCKNTYVSVNGHYTQWFNVYCGVRQGDPCSLYLYPIWVVVLSSMIRNNQVG